MKKLFYISIAALSFAALTLSCSKEIATEEEIVNPGDQTEKPVTGKTITISATLSDALTKVTFTPGLNGSDKPMMALTWESGDKLCVADAYDHSRYSEFELVSGAGTKSAIFSGDPVSAASYDIWVVNADDPTAMQVQASDGDATHIQYVAQATGISDLAADINFTEVSSVLGLQAKLPAGAAATITSVVLTASEDIFFGGKTLTLGITTPGDTGTDDILNLYATLPGEQTIPDGTTLFVKFNSNNASHSVYTAYRELGSGLSFASGALNNLKMNCVNTDKYAGKDDDGTSEHPYLIADKYQMGYIDNLMEHATTKYFKLLDNINMSGVSWTKLNDHDSTYDQGIDFDGNSKTISDLGGTMFYVFKGTVRNLTLVNPAISTGQHKGAFAQYIQGTNNFITNVDVSNVASFDASNGNCGGLIGRINSGSSGYITATIENCDLTNVVVNSNGVAGGLIGSVEAKVVIDHCTCTNSSVSNTSNYAGGLIGKATAEVVISDCSVTGSVSAVQYTAGLVGYFTSGSISNTHSSANVTCSGHYAGALIAYMVDGSIEQSYTTGDVTATAKCYRVGGLVGYAESGLLSQCYATGNMSGTSTQYFGGMIGTASPASGKAVTISECCYTTGSISPSGNYGGGIVGSKEGAGALSISNCFVSGTVASSGPQRFGGILAGHLNGTTTIENCYVSGVIRANACIGGIVGWVEVNGLSVNRCMPFPSELHATQTVATADRYCSGLVIGYARKENSPTMIVNHCYRSAAIASNFSDYSGVAAINVVEDHEFITPAAAIPQRHGLTYGYYHHGQETSSATLSALVQRDDIGGAWNSSIWDFEQDYPRLKWMLP